MGRPTFITYGGIVGVLVGLFGCRTHATPSVEPPSLMDAGEVSAEGFADVREVAVSGSQGSYTFRVTLESPDTGCDRYADWWEVLDEEGRLLYRRILAHSHVDEQPFSRSGGPVTIEAQTRVFVRGHMNVGGYGGAVMAGTPTGNFEVTQFDEDFAVEVESLPPQPSGCAF